MSSLVAFILNLLTGDRDHQANEKKTKIWGKTTRDLLKVFNKYQDDHDRLPMSRLREAFNSIGLYPSNSQVFEMVQCAVEYGSPCEPDYITFGEFGVFASELKAHYTRRPVPPIPLSLYRERTNVSSPCSRWKRRVFLGGSCNPTTWRRDYAIPFFKKRGITFYNPQVQTWRPELMELEAEARQTADLMFFVIDNQTRAIVSMLETAYLVACKKQVIVVLDNYSSVDDITFHGEKVSEQELEDMNRARKILIDLLERNSVPVFTNMNVALECAAVVLNQGITVKELGLKHGAQPTMYGHLKVGEMILQVREAFNSVDTSKNGQLSANDLILAYRGCMNQELDPDWLKEHSNGRKTYSFEDFCCIIAEHHHRVKPIYHKVIDVFQALFARFSEHSIMCTEPRHSGDMMRDIYLGGSCGDSHWRERIAIPKLRKAGLSYANPAVVTSGWEQRLIPIQVAAREKCRLLLYIITNRTRSISSMIEAGYYIGMGCRIVLCVMDLPEHADVGGETISDCALKDYRRGRSYLIDLASRDGVPIFEDINEAVDCAINSMVDQCSAHVSHVMSPSNSPQKKSRSPTL